MRQILIDKPEGADVAPFISKDSSTGFVYIQRELPKLDYFWIENLEDAAGEVVFSLQGSTNFRPVALEYSIDRGETWTEFNTRALTSRNTSLSIAIPAKTTMYLRGNNECFGVSSSIYTKISCSKQHNIGGNLVSLLSKNLVKPKTFPNYCFEMLFYNDLKLIDASKLIMLSKTSSYCYYGMFKGCTSLTTTPKLPATTLADHCYNAMFQGCTSLTTTPSILPATTLADHCYSNMFSGCTSLTTTPKLPATTLADYCYSSMFYGCTSLTTAPELPATTLAEYCYQRMFYNCTALTTAPELPATTLAKYCCYYMFYGCTALTTAPELPATTLAQYCYSSMFQGCTSLTTAPELPATTLAQYCYSSMFQGCTSLTTAPELPATTLAQYCYDSMFKGCTGLTTAPVLPATTLVDRCYYEMFYNCTNLNYVKALFTSKQSNSLDNWLNRTASIGIFVKNHDANWNASNINLPSGWTIKDTDNYTIIVNYKTIDGNILHTETISDKFLNVASFVPNATIDGYIYDNSELEILNDGQIFDILIYPTVTYTVTRKYQDSEGKTVKEDDTISYTVGIGGMNEVDIEPSVESIEFNGDTYYFDKQKLILTDNTEVTFISYQTTISWSGDWIIDESNYSYPCYRSNKISHNQSTVQRLTFKGVNEIVIKMIYNSDNNDYLTYGNIDAPCSRTNYLGTLKGTSGTWQTVTFTPTDCGEHYIEFCYSKDNAISSGTDCAWVYIESINGKEINGIGIPSDTYDSDGYDIDGYDRDGYDRDGYDRDGYDEDGYNRDCIHKNGFVYEYDPNFKFKKLTNTISYKGFDNLEFEVYDNNEHLYGYAIGFLSQSGYYNFNGNDCVIVDLDGYDSEGYDSNGYDRDGYNRSGYDRAGYDKSGYDSDGYDIHGYDRYGNYDRYYDRDGKIETALNTSSSDFWKSGYHQLTDADREILDLDSGFAYYYIKENEYNISSQWYYYDHCNSGYYKVYDNNGKYIYDSENVEYYN